MKATPETSLAAILGDTPPPTIFISSIDVNVRVLALRSTPASSVIISDPPPPLMLILAEGPSPAVVMLIVSADPPELITNPALSDVIQSIFIVSTAEPV